MRFAKSILSFPGWSAILSIRYAFHIKNKSLHKSKQNICTILNNKMYSYKSDTLQLSAAASYSNTQL